MLTNRRIFIVEDNLENRMVVQMILMSQGVQSEFDRWGNHTIKKLKDFMPVDVILLDLMFPMGVTGYQVFDQIRRYEEFDHIPIVAVSAANPSEAIPKCRQKGFAGFIPKPIDDELFPEQLAGIIEGKALWQAG